MVSEGRLSKQGFQNLDTCKRAFGRDLSKEIAARLRECIDDAVKLEIVTEEAKLYQEFEKVTTAIDMHMRSF